jgi:hypothetical protein
MTSRAQYFRNTTKHAQRGPEAKRKLIDKDVATAWVGPFISSIQGLATYLTVDSMIVMQLGETPRDRELKLRELCKLGVLTMDAHRDANGQFVEYRWTLLG